MGLVVRYGNGVTSPVLGVRCGGNGGFDLPSGNRKLIRPNGLEDLVSQKLTLLVVGSAVLGFGEGEAKMLKRQREALGGMQGEESRIRYVGLGNVCCHEARLAP